MQTAAQVNAWSKDVADAQAVVEAARRAREAEAVRQATAAVEVAQSQPAPVTAQVAAPVGGDIQSIIIAAANAHGVSADMMLRIARCESGLNPGSVNYKYSVAGTHPSGLFQHVALYWPGRASAYGYPGASVFDAVANANVTAAMMAAEGTSAWECR